MCIFPKPKQTVDVPSPGGIVNADDIKYKEYAQMLEVLNLKPPVWVTTVANTKSMDPLIDAGDIAILSQDFKHEELILGDVIVYEALDKTILHRIIAIAETSGIEEPMHRVYTCQGDNTAYPDPYQLLDEHINWYFIGVFYCRKEASS